MSRVKSLKKLLIEIVLCFTVVALVSHLSTNFWERYVMHKELSSMKNNFEILKATINNIGNVYDNLHNDLLEIAQNHSPKHPPTRRYTKFSHTNQDQKCIKTIYDELIKEIHKKEVYTAFKKEIPNPNMLYKTKKCQESKKATSVTRLV